MNFLARPPDAQVASLGFEHSFIGYTALILIANTLGFW